jgi:hypothetical protein
VRRPQSRCARRRCPLLNCNALVSSCTAEERRAAGRNGVGAKRSGIRASCGETERSVGAKRRSGAESPRTTPENRGVSGDTVEVPLSEPRSKQLDTREVQFSRGFRRSRATRMRYACPLSECPKSVRQIVCCGFFGRAPALVIRMLWLCLGRELVCSNWRALDPERRLTT